MSRSALRLVRDHEQAARCRLDAMVAVTAAEEHALTVGETLRAYAAVGFDLAEQRRGLAERRARLDAERARRVAEGWAEPLPEDG